jgi:GNAT superfamily N-acetyltransferase
MGNTTNWMAPSPLAIPDTDLARHTIDMVTRSESPAIANHSIRSYLFARMLAVHQGAEAGRDYDARLLFLACTLHDIGLSEAGNRHQRFEVDGADTAAEFLTGQGLPAAEVDAVWEAIALHTSAQIAERRSTLCQLTSAGIGIDFGQDSEFITDVDGAAIHRAYPRHSIATALVDAVVEQARSRPEKAPAYSFAAELVRQRGLPDPVTTLERRSNAARWGN